MKHEVTSYNTKKVLAEALKKKMRVKPFSKISVSEIIAACGVNRKTFYYHFEDIYALLKWMFEEEAIRVVKHFDLLVDYEEAVNFVMDYVENNQHIINCAYDSIGLERMKGFFYADFIDLTSSLIESAQQKMSISLEPDFKLFLSQFYTEALAGMLIGWVQQGENRDRQKVLRYLTETIKGSLTGILTEHGKPEKQNHI